MARADQSVNPTVMLCFSVNRPLHAAQNTLCKRAVNAAAARTVEHAAVQTTFAGYAGLKVKHHMVRTKNLRIMNRLHNRNAKFPNAVDHRRGQLKIDIIYMYNIRTEMRGDRANLPFCLKRIKNPERIPIPFPSFCVKIHRGSSQLKRVSDNIPAVLHPKIFHGMPLFPQIISEFQNIGLSAAPRIEKFIYHQYLQSKLISFHTRTVPLSWYPHPVKPFRRNHYFLHKTKEPQKEKKYVFL